MGIYDDLPMENAYDDLPKESPSVTNKRRMMEIAAKEGLKATVPGQIYSKGVEAVSEFAPEFGKGVVRGASFGRLLNEQPKKTAYVPAKTSIESAGVKSGELVGEAIPWILAEIVSGGLSNTALVAKWGLSAVQKAIAVGTATGAIHGYAEGVATNKPLAEIPGTMINQAAAAGTLGVGGQALGKARRFLAGTVAEEGANAFLKPPKKTAVDRLLKGDISLGNQYLDDPIAIGSMTRTEALGRVKSELARLENQAQGLVGKYKEMATTPIENTAKVSGIPRLEYNPTVIENIGLNKNPNPYDAKVMQAERDPYWGTKRPGTFTNPYEVKVETPKTQDISTGEGLFTTDAGRTGTNPNIPSGMKKEHFLLQQKSARSAAAPIKQGPNVDISSIKSSLDEIANMEEKFNVFPTERRHLNQIRMMQAQIASKGHMTIGDALQFRRYLDNQVGQAYLQGVPDRKIAFLIDVKKNLANAIREKIIESAPELANIMKRESQLLEYQYSLAPQVAYSPVSGVFSTEPALASANLGIAKGLRATMGKPSEIIAPITRQASRIISKDEVGDYFQ